MLISIFLPQCWGFNPRSYTGSAGILQLSFIPSPPFSIFLLVLQNTQDPIIDIYLYNIHLCFAILYRYITLFYRLKLYTVYFFLIYKHNYIYWYCIFEIIVQLHFSLHFLPSKPSLTSLLTHLQIDRQLLSKYVWANISWTKMTPMVMPNWTGKHPWGFNSTHRFIGNKWNWGVGKSLPISCPLPNSQRWKSILTSSIKSFLCVYVCVYVTLATVWMYSIFILTGDNEMRYLNKENRDNNVYYVYKIDSSLRSTLMDHGLRVGK